MKDYFLDFTASKESIELKEKFQHSEKIEQLILENPYRDKYYAKVVERNIGKCINLKKLSIIGAGSLPEILKNCRELEFL